MSILVLIRRTLLKVRSSFQYPAYRLARHNVFEEKAVRFSWSAIVARLWQNSLLKLRHLFRSESRCIPAFECFVLLFKIRC